MANVEEIILLSSDDEDTDISRKNTSLPIIPVTPNGNHNGSIDQTKLSTSLPIPKKVKFGANEIYHLPPDDQYLWPEISTVTAVSDNVHNGNEEPTRSNLPVGSTKPTTASTSLTNATKRKSIPSQPSKTVKRRKVNGASTLTFVTPKYEEKVVQKRITPVLVSKSTSKHTYIPLLSGYQLDARKTSSPSTSKAASVSNVTLKQCHDFISQVVSETDKTKKNLNIDQSSKSGLTIEETTPKPLTIELIENNLHDDQTFDISKIKSNTLRTFLSKCVSSEIERSTVQKIQSRIRSMHSNFKLVNEYYRRSLDFKTTLSEYGGRISSHPESALEYFDMVFDIIESKAFQPAEETAIDKLVDLLDQYSAKIKELEESEIGIEDEANSSYLQTNFYARKFCKVYKLWCRKTGEYFYRGRATHKRLDYGGSEYREFNNAVNEMYRKNFKFPSYDDIDQVIRNCVEQHNIMISPSELKHEIGKVFRDVGKECQNRRIHDTVDCLYDFLGSQRDPALNNAELDSKLKEQVKEGHRKIQEVFELYVKKQTDGPAANSDGNSEDESSDTENEEEQMSDDHCDNDDNNFDLDFDLDFDFVDNFVPDNLSIKTDTHTDSDVLSD